MGSGTVIMKINLSKKEIAVGRNGGNSDEIYDI